MSAPVSHNDKANADGPGFYAPPGARRSPASDQQSEPQPVPTQSAPAPATARDSADAGSEQPVPLPAPAAVSPPMAPPAAAAAAEQGERVVPSELPPATPVSRMARGMGGPNIECPPALMQRVATPVSTPAAPPAAGGTEFDRPPQSPRSPRPPRPPRSQPRPFVGDIAVVTLRRRLALDPGLAPEPPLSGEPQRRRSLLQALLRLTVFALAAAVVAFGLTLLSLPDLRPREVRLPAVKQDKVVATAHLPTGMPMPGMPTTTRLVVEGRQAFANEPLPLGISLTGAIGGEFALLTGLATGTRFSIGSPSGNDGWRLPAGDLTRAFAFAPQNFVGVMQTAVDLRAGNDTLIDSQAMRLEWMPKPIDISAQPSRRDGEAVKPAAAAAAAPATPPLDPEELATLVRRGQDFIRTGDLAAARLVLRRAVTTDDAQAALALATTFDPLVFAELGVLGFQPDLAQARTWYGRAVQLGSQEAQRRLDRLARLPP